jgi:hypothetical protein
MTATKTPATRTHDLPDGLFLIAEFSATGGVEYRRTATETETSGDAIREEYAGIKRVDHVGLVSLSRQLVARAERAVASRATRTPLGWYVETARVTEVFAALEDLQREAQDFNVAATAANSERRVRIAAYPMQIALDPVLAAERLRALVRERLGHLRDALVARDAGAAKNALTRAAGIERLAHGVLRDAVVFAIEDARAGIKALASGDEIDTSQIDAAIADFT